MNKIDPWLYLGCICKVRNDGDECQLRYFYKISGTGHFCFVKSIGAKEEVFEHYVPVGTPWDYAPKEANYITINSYGMCLFSKSIKDNDYSHCIKFYAVPIMFVFNSCPEHLKDKILPRPEWAK